MRSSKDGRGTKGFAGLESLISDLDEESRDNKLIDSSQSRPSEPASNDLSKSQNTSNSLPHSDLLSEEPDYQHLSLSEMPSTPAPWSSSEPGEGWQWGKYFVILQINPEPIYDQIMREKGSTEKYVGISYPYVATVFRDPDQNKHGPSACPVYIVSIEKSLFGTCMIGAFDGEGVHLNMGTYNGPMDIENAREKLFAYIKKRFELDSIPKSLGSIENVKAIYESRYLIDEAISVKAERSQNAAQPHSEVKASETNDNLKRGGGAKKGTNRLIIVASIITIIIIFKSISEPNNTNNKSYGPYTQPPPVTRRDTSDTNQLSPSVITQSTTASPSYNDPAERSKRIQVLFAANDWTGLIREIESGPNAASEMNLLGIAHHNLGNIQEAMRFFSEAERAYPNDPIIKCNYAMALFDNSNYTVSLDKFRQGIAIDSNSKHCQNGLLNAEYAYNKILSQARLEKQQKQEAERVRRTEKMLAERKREAEMRSSEIVYSAKDNKHYDARNMPKKCSYGYILAADECKMVEIPQFGLLNRNGDGWICSEGYKRQGDVCISLPPPPENARYVDERGYPSERWTCNKGYISTTIKCIPSGG